MSENSLEDNLVDNNTYFLRGSYFSDVSDKEGYNLFNKSNHALPFTVHRAKTTMKKKSRESGSTTSRSLDSTTKQYTGRVISPWRYPFPVKKHKKVKSSTSYNRSTKQTSKLSRSMNKTSKLTNMTTHPSLNSTLSPSLLKKFTGTGIDVQQLPVYADIPPTPRQFHRHSISVLDQPIEDVSCPHCLLIKNGILWRYPVYWSKTLFGRKDTMDVTFVSVLTSQRIPFITPLSQRWPGQMTFVLYASNSELKNVTTQLINNSYPDRIQILIMAHRRKTSFPINFLRNLGIAITTTSHFIVMDMDMWPAPNLYNELTSLGSEYTKPNSAVIVPAIFLNPHLVKKQCTTLEECAQVSVQLFPTTKEELRECIASHTCQLSKHPQNRNHLLLNKAWLNKDFPRITRVNCFPNRFQEPYVMLAKEYSHIWFNQAFVNYGCNKVQMIEHLRATNHVFYILQNSFAVDIAHHNSVYRTTYIYDYGTRMRRLCYRFLSQLDIQYGNNYVTPLC